LVELNFLDS